MTTNELTQTNTSSDFQHIIIVGATGAIGAALLDDCAERYPQANIFAYARTLPSTPASTRDREGNITTAALDCFDESALQTLIQHHQHAGACDLIIVATGMLHGPSLSPEKSLSMLNQATLEKLFLVNTILPSLVLKHFAPILTKQKKAVFAALSARVGSLSDNQLGGWYGYRATKAALNMMIKTAAIEIKRSHRHTAVVGLHPGTVDSALSKPFQSRIPPEKLFTPKIAASHLLDVIEGLTPNDTGQVFAWDGVRIPY